MENTHYRVSLQLQEDSANFAAVTQMIDDDPIHTDQQTPNTTNPYDNLFCFSDLKQGDHPLKLPIYSVEQKSMASLMQLLDSRNCPDYALPKIIDWANHAYKSGFNFHPKTKDLNNNLKWISKAVSNADQILPSISTLQLKNKDKLVDV